MVVLVFPTPINKTSPYPHVNKVTSLLNFTMPHIFRFHKGRNNNIYDWKASDKIMPTDVRDVMDKTNILSSSAGTSIPTPIGRMFLFKTAFEIIAAQVRDNQVNSKSIYAAIVSETLDLLELLYKSGSDENKFRYQNWVFDNGKLDDAATLNFFGNQPGHRLLAESFKQAASQKPFNNSIPITLIYYREGTKEILMGGTSPFSFVFTSPNFKRKLQDRGFRAINGLVSNDVLFDQDYKQLQERDESFIKYMESLVTGGSDTFSGFTEYVINTRNRYHSTFNGTVPDLKDIQFNDVPLSAANVVLKQVSEQDYRSKISLYSDFKMTLPADTHYKDVLKPLFLLNEMAYEGVYTSPASLWSAKTRVSEMDYPETTVEEIMNRELPGMNGFTYPFLSSFDIFERCLVKLPNYTLNDERFVTLIGNQGFLLPVKPLFFHFFPVARLAEYISVETRSKRGSNGDMADVVTVTVTIPINGTGKGSRKITSKRSYSSVTGDEKEKIFPVLEYRGILGIFPLTRATQSELLHINKYTIASFEKTNAPFPVEAVRFFKKNGTNTVATVPVLRSKYDDINTKTTYYQVPESFDMIQLNFKQDNANCGGVIIPKFRDVTNGTEEYVYAIDFGTSNTHVEYGRVVNEKVTETYPFTITESNMQMTLLNKPREVVLDDGAVRYRDYESNMGNEIETARQLTLREYVPFQIGPQKSASVKFPFKTATCESDNFTTNQANNRLFVDANIGFNIDEDSLLDYIRYRTDLKWLLEQAGNNQFHLNRVSIFFQELLLMIRTKVLLEDINLKGDIFKVQIAMSLPVSMGPSLRGLLTRLMDAQRTEIFSKNAPPLKLISESVAPYYQLRYINNNIQNDSSCNIDIGGGTTDIVLINRNATNYNELNCYCSSFKFAGRQLWSSGHNEFNSDNNGFIAYYKTFIEKADNNVYRKLQRVLNSKAQRTEDMVAVLFSKPEYRFIDIFSEYKELKAVLIIHYSAILYYITRLAQLTKIDLPRTVSFSGKGSEYLSVIFPSNNALRAFTYKALTIFSGATVRNDFLVERSNEPKVITAKGSAHFATEKVNQQDDSWENDTTSNEKRLVLVETNYKGFHNLVLESENITYKNLMEKEDLYNDIMKSVEEFFHLLFDNADLCAQLNRNLEFSDFTKYKNFFIPPGIDITKEGRLRDSFKATVANAQLNDKVADSPFFFALNYSLTEFSKEIANAASHK